LLQRPVGDLGWSKQDAFAVIEEELDNILAAWRWATAGEWVKELQGSALRLRAFYSHQARFHDAKAVFAQAIAGLRETEPAHHAALGHVLVEAAWIHHHLEQSEEAKVV
jgi:hypothetical protein